MFPEIVDASHATPKAAEFFHSFLTAKSRHDVDATKNHFSKTTLTTSTQRLAGRSIRMTRSRMCSYSKCRNGRPRLFPIQRLFWEMSTARSWL